MEAQPRWCWGCCGVQWGVLSMFVLGCGGMHVQHVCGGVQWGAVGGVQRVRDSSTTRHRIPACLPSPWQPPGNQR